MHLIVKICGLSSEETLDAALDAGADMVGFVFFPASPRFLSPERASRLAARARGRAEIVALTVDMDDAGLEAIVAALDPDWLQLHGKEPPERVAAVEEALRPEGHEGDRRPRGGRPRRGRSLCRHRRPPAPRRQAAQGRRYRPAATAPPSTGGSSSGFDPGMPCLLSGGLDAGNVGEALRHHARASGVDVSSGVETAPGRKRPRSDPRLRRRRAVAPSVQARRAETVAS